MFFCCLRFIMDVDTPIPSHIFKCRNRNEVNAMLQHKAYRFRLYPTHDQEILIAKTIGCARFVYNYFLNRWNEAYVNTGKGLSYSTCSAMLPKM